MNEFLSYPLLSLGLLSNDDPARFEASLAVAEKLIRKTPVELQEVGFFISILLFQNGYKL